jgi:tetratricopeptide (TPR) repeat protein
MIRTLFLWFVVLILVSGCAMPRVLVLDDPLTPQEHLKLGLAYEKEGEFDNAVKEYETAAGKIPLAYLYLGNTYFQKNELNQAEKMYKKAITELTQNADARNNLAWLYYVKGTNLDEAERLALRAIELNPSKQAIYQDTLVKVRKLKGSVTRRPLP